MALPLPSVNQPFCTVSALEGGQLSASLSVILSGAASDSTITLPSLSFLITHSRTSSKFLFDLGIRKDWENYPPAVVQHIRTECNVDVSKDVRDSLHQGGLLPDDIEVIVLSHSHFDHIGDLSPFTKARVLVGGESVTLFEPGYPADPLSVFDSTHLPHDRTEFLSTADWVPLGPFPKAHDFYGDGSLYIVDAPGHLPGHLNILARTSSDGGWIYLAGDSAHHWSLITGEGQIAVSHGRCAHRDKAVAEQTIRNIQELIKIERVRVLLAHDEPWYEKNKDGNAFWPGNIQSL